MTTDATQQRAPGLPHVDVREYGGKKNGVQQSMDERLFMQLIVLEASGNAVAGAGARLGETLGAAKVPGVVYEDANHPRRFGVLSWSTDPAHFVTNVRPVLNAPENASLAIVPEFTMIGRTYSVGYEPDLAYWLLERPIEHAVHPEYKWAVWYPLRRTGAFNKLPDHDQGMILREHAAIGRAYGEQNLAHDIRLACHGMDTHDNEFLVALLGSSLHPLSHVVQAMRKTVQTSQYMQHMGPFFVGHAIWQRR